MKNNKSREIDAGSVLSGIWHLCEYHRAGRKQPGRFFNDKGLFPVSGDMPVAFAAPAARCG